MFKEKFYWWIELYCPECMSTDGAVGFQWKKLPFKGPADRHKYKFWYADEMIVLTKEQKDQLIKEHKKVCLHYLKQ